VVLVPHDLEVRGQASEWAALARDAWPAASLTLRPAALDDDEDDALLEELADQAEDTAVVVLVEGWRPCLEAFRYYLRQLRRSLGRERPVVVGLVGRPDGGARAPTQRGDLRQWRRRLAELDDPYLEVVPVGGEGE
jgi:hypothetical protein